MIGPAPLASQLAPALKVVYSGLVSGGGDGGGGDGGGLGGGGLGGGGGDGSLGGLTMHVLSFIHLHTSFEALHSSLPKPTHAFGALAKQTHVSLSVQSPVFVPAELNLSDPPSK